MRQLLLALSAAVLGVIFTQVALAADLPIKAPVAPVAAVPNWTGFYFGGAVGARWANNDWRSSDLFPTFGPTPQVGNTSGAMASAGARFSAYAGYNWQFAPTWIAGIEADIGWANNSKTANPLPGTNNTAAPLGLPIGTVKETWDGSLRGRLGYLVTPDTLLYGTGGVAWQHVRLSAYCPTNGAVVFFCFLPQNESHSKTMTGWTVGGGLEMKVWGNWLARIDYRYADFGTFDQVFFTANPPFFDDRFTAHVKVQTHTVTVGLAYLF